MNKQIYKIIFSKRLGTLVAVGEHATSAGKAASGQGCRGTVVADGFVGALRFTFASVALACLSLGTQAQSTVVALASTALPQGGSVSTGLAAISTNGANMAITQSTDKASINWQSFNVGTAASVNIAQPSSDAVLLNRVVGNDPSQILGKLTANGQVILLNPNGVVFGNNGSVTASSFTASTFGLSDADFMAGYYKYNRNGSTAAVVNQGTIETSAGGFVALIGATVTNEGRIITPQGDVVMAAAESVTLPEELVKPQPAPTPSTVGVRMSKRVRLELDSAAVNTAVSNTESGVIVTEGGQVMLQAAAISTAVASVTHSGRIDTSAPQAGAVTVLADNGVIKVDGSITANSSGTDSQGQARKGADIIIGRDEETHVLARATDVRGANLESQGGFVETSGDWLATNGVRVKAKDWLLDPTDIKIVASNTAADDTRSVTSGGTTTLQDNTGILASEVLKSTIESAINAGTNVTISTANPTVGANGAGNITIETALSFNNTGSQAATLRLSAVNGITQNAGATITATGSQMVHIDMAAEGRYMGNPAANAGSLGITLNSAITTNGDVTLNGKATHTDAGNATYGIGVNGWTNANISARNISITGNSTNSFGINYRGGLTASGNITQDGTSQNWVGVVSSGAVNATGALSITGKTISGGYQGINIDSNIQGATVTLSGESNANAGVSLANARSITSTVGDIAITGTSAGGNGITVGSDGSTTASANIRSARNMSLVGQGTNTGIKVWFSSVLAAGNSSTAGTINLSGTSVTGAGQTGYGIDFSRYPNAATLTATADINIVGTLSGLGDGSAIKTSWSGQNGNGPTMTAGGKFTLRGNNRAAATNTSATVNAESGMQINAAGDIVLQAETNNDNVGAIVFYSTSDMYRGNTSLVSTAGDVLIQANQGGIRFNNQQASTAGKLTTISGRNISIDNTGAGMATGAGSLVGSGGTTGATIGSGSINASTGAITSGVGKAQAEGLNFADARSITASGQLHLTGISRTAEGIKSVANLTGASITANGSSDTSMGINATAGSFTATSGAVNLTGRNLVSGGRGMTLSGTVSAVGDVNLSGYSVSTGDRHGMVITNAVASSGGNINLTGQTTASTVPAITITGSSAAVSVSNGRSININANSLNLESSATLNAGTGTVNIKTLTTGNEIVVGGSDVLGNTLTSQKLGIANSELNLISAGRVVIGDINSTGAIQVTGATTTLASTGNIDLRTGGTINVAAAFNVNKNLTLQTNGGNIATAAAVTGTHISIDNTNGTIDSSTGAILVGARSATGTDGITLGGDVTASGNLNLYGVSSNQYGIQLAANKTIRGGVIQGTGRTSSGYSAVLFNGGSNVITTGSSGDSLITAYSTGGSGAFYTSANVTAASGTTLTLDGQATNTGGRGMRLEGWTTATGRVTLKGSSDNSTDGLISINGQVTAAANSQLSIVGTTNKAGSPGVAFVNGGGVALSSGATLDVNGQSTSTSGTGYGVSIQGNGITKLTGAGAVSITGSTSSTTVGALGVYVAAGVATDGNIDIQGNGASSANSAVHIGAAVTSAGTGTTINIDSNYAITHDGSISVSGATGTGGNINLTSTNRGIWGAGTIGTTTNKNANVTFTQSTTSTFDGAINAANFNKAGAGSLTLDSWIATTPATTNISNAYTVNSGELSLSLSGTYPSLNPASVNVVNNATFSLSNAGNGFWRNTAFNFTGGLGGGTMNLLGNPVGASNTINTFSTSGGATNTVNGLLNANNANVNLNLAQATSGTSLLDGSFAALVFAQNSQGGFGIDNATTINANGPGGLLFKDKLKATQFNINSGTVQFGDGTAAAAATTPDLQATNVAIASGAKLIFNRAEASTNVSAFSGSGELIQAGAGALTLTGNSAAFAGSTTVNDGRALAVGTNGSLGAAGSTINLASATSSVAFTNASGTSTIGSTISGAGTLSKSGNGTGVLTANNSYTGTTTISAGTLQIGNGDATGTLGSGAVVDNAALIINRDVSADTTIANAISGSGTLTQAGLGKTILTGSNTYSGTTTISAGTLQVGNGGATGTLGSGAVVDNAALIIKRDVSTDTTIASAISGSGTLTQAGLGKTILTGTNTYSGTTTISAGTLQVGNGGATGTLGSGAVVDNAALIINRDASTDITIAGDISGTGTLTQAGLGKTILTGTNTCSGTTTISAGTLQIGNDTTTGTLGTGAVINNAVLDFKRSANTNVTNTITGSGDMQATLSAGGLRLLGNVTLGGDIDLTAEHATDWIGVQFLSDVSAGGDINISGGSSTRHGVQVDAFKTLKTTSLGAQSVTITGSTSSASSAGIAVIGEIQTNNGSTLLATGTATNGGNGIYSELTTGGTNYGKIGSATSGDITLVGTSSGGTAPTSINSDAALNKGHGILLRGGITTQGHISLTGEADNGVGVFLQHSTYDYGRTMAEAQPTLQVLSGGANMAGQDAISISGTNFGSNPFNNNGVLIGSKLINNSNGGATTITSAEGGIALVTSTTGTSTGSGTITNAATAGAISLTAGDGTATSSASIGSMPVSIGTGNNVSRAWTLSPAGTQITQNSNAGVTMTSDGTGNVTPSKIVNNGTGDVVIGAGTQLNAGDGTGGQVLTVSGNTISQNNFGKTYVYTGAAASTGALSNLSSSFNTLYFTGTAPAAFNSAFNTAFGSTIASGQNAQVLFRDSAGPNFVVNLPNITKTYGDADPVNLNTAIQTAYTNSGGGAYLTQAVSGAAGSSNTFAIKASELIADVSITRTAGEAVGNYALSMVGTTMNANITGSTALSIGKRDITLAGITASNKTYDGSNAATITAGTFNNLKAGETLLISGTGSFADANVGNGKTVTANIANLNKTDGLGSWSNYNLTSTGNANGSANITPAALTITVNGSSAYVTQDPNSAFNQGFSYSGFVNGETAASALSAAPTRAYEGGPNPSVGNYVNAYGIGNVVSAKNGNYTITVNKGALNVIAADALLLNVASQSSVYGSITAANADTPAANSVTAQYCLVPGDCNGSNIVNLSLRKDTAVPNQWVVNDSTSSTVQFTTALQNTSYSSGGYLQVGNYDYSLTSGSPLVIGTQNFNTVVSNTGILSVTPLAVSLQNTPISKAYDGTTSLPNTTLSISNLPTGDDLQASFTAGAFQSSAVSTAAPFSLYGVALAGTDSGNYTLQNYANNTYSSTGVITGTSSKPQPIVHPPKPIIPTDNTSGGGESGGDSSSGNPYLLIPSGRPNSADRCTPNTLEDCLCETQEPRPVEGIAICYQPKKTANHTPAAKTRKS